VSDQDGSRPRDLQLLLRRGKAVFDSYMAAAGCKAINDGSRAEWLSWRSRGCALPLGADGRRLILGGRREIEKPRRRTTDYVFRVVLAQGEKACGGRRQRLAGLSGPPKKPQNCRSLVHAGVRIAERRARSAGRPIVYRILFLYEGRQRFQAPGAKSDFTKGVFLNFPASRWYADLESGVSGDAGLMWRANKGTWPAAVPASKCPGSIREAGGRFMARHIRLTTQPFDTRPPDGGRVDERMQNFTP